MEAQAPPDYQEKAGETWYGHYPCVCAQGNGCDKHNPSQTQMYHNKRLLAASKPKLKLTMRLRQQLLPSAHRKEKAAKTNDDREPDSKSSLAASHMSASLTERPADFFSTSLPLDIYAAEAIPPIHPCLPYYLSFYHLNCASRNNLFMGSPALIEELSCHGTSSPSDPGAQHQWRSEVYCENRKFFQYQTIRFDVTRQRPLGLPSFTFCRHFSCNTGPIQFYNHNGFEHAKFRRPFKYHADPDDPKSPLLRGSRTTADGDYIKAWNCSNCLTDGVASIVLQGDALRLQFEVFRALGSGEGRPTDPACSAWTALLTGKGRPRLKNYNAAYEVEIAVKTVASRAGRPIPTPSTATEDEYFA